MKMKTTILGFLFTLMLSSAGAQIIPKPTGSYVNSGSGWTPLLGTATAGAITYNPPPAALYVLNSSTGQWVPWDGSGGGGGGGGTVTTFTAGNLPHLFTTSVATASSTPALSFTLSQQAANTFFGNFTNAPGVPTFSTNPTFPTGQFAASSRVSPLSSAQGLIGEYHYTEASGATTGIDFSGLGNNGTYFGTPTLTGTLKGGMTSAGNGGMDLPVAFNTTGLTIANFLCTNAQTTVANPNYAVVVAGLAGATAPTIANPQMFGMMLQGTQGASPLGLSFGKYGLSPTILNQTSPTVATISTQAGETLNACHLATWVRGTSVDQFFIDDHEVSFYQYQNAGSATTTPASGSFSVGMPHYATLPQAGFASPYPIFYTFVFNTALTADQVRALAGSAAGAAEFRGITKGKATYSDAGNQELAIGDSITYGLNVTTAWPRNLTTVVPYTTVNIATPGWQLENLITECDTRALGAIDPNMNTTMSVMAGTNDMLQVGGALPNVTAAIAYQRTRRVIQCLHSLKPTPRVIVVTMLARGVASGAHTPANDTAKNALNDSVRKDWAGADGIFDAAAFAGLGSDGAADTGASATACNGNPCFGGDHVHPTQSGHDVMRSGYSQTLDYYDSIKNGMNPILITAATQTLTASNVAVNANPTTNSQTLTLPSTYGLVGTERYIYNAQATGSNTLTIAAASGENINGNASVVCGNLQRCTFRAVLGATQATANADSTSGGHWEQTSGLASGGGGSGNATSIQNVPVDPTAPTSSQVLGYNGTSWIPTSVAGATVPTGTGFYHITGGVADPAAAALPIASPSVQGISNCDNITITCTSGILSAVGGSGNATSLQGTAISATAPTTGQVLGYNGTNWIPTAAGGGGAGLGANTFTGLQIMPSLQDTVVNDTGLVNAAVVANTSVTVLSAGEILTFNPVATNTTTTPTLNVNNLGAKTITRFGNAAVAAGDLVTGTTAIVLYNSGGSGTWQLLNPATTASTVSPTFTGTTTLGGTAANFTAGVIQKSGQGVHFTNQCVVTLAANATTGTCTITGGATANACTWSASNALARTLINNAVSGSAITSSGNIPYISMSGTTATLNFLTGGGATFINTPASGETFNVVCPI